MQNIERKYKVYLKFTALVLLIAVFIGLLSFSVYAMRHPKFDRSRLLITDGSVKAAASVALPALPRTDNTEPAGDRKENIAPAGDEEENIVSADNEEENAAQSGLTQAGSEQTTAPGTEGTDLNPILQSPVTPVKPLDYAKLFVSAASGEIGTRESKYNNIKYNTWYYGFEVSAENSRSDTYAWCVTFICWCANEAGIGTDIITRSASAEDFRSFFVGQNTFYKRQSGYTPSAGDIVFFGSGSAEHVGIVQSVENGIITTIEGNFSDKVVSLTYKLSNTDILGYASPDFGGNHNIDAK